MAAIIGALRADLSASVAAFEQDMAAAGKAVEQFSKRAEKISANLTDIGAKMSLAITAPFIALSFRATQGAKDAANASGQVQAALDSMGGASGKTLEELQALSLELRGLSTFDDDDIMTKSTANLLTFGKVAGEVFDRASVAILDVSARLGNDLQASTMLVGKALNDPIRGLNQLRRVGIQFTKAQEDTVKKMVETNRVAEAQGVLLSELERQFGGSAAAQRQADMWSGLRDVWRDVEGVLERIATTVLPPLIGVLERLGSAFVALPESMQNMIVGVVAVVAAIGPLLVGLGAVVGMIGNLAPLWGAFSAAVAKAGLAAGITDAGVAMRALTTFLGPFAKAIAIVVASALAFRGAFSEAFGYLVTQFQTQVWPALQRMGQAFGELFAAIDDLLTNGPIGELVRFIGWAVAEITALLFQGLGHAFLTLVTTVADAVTTLINLTAGMVKFISALLKGDFSGAWEIAKDTVSDFADGILRTLENLLPGITGQVTQIGEMFSNFLSNMIHAALTWIEARFPGLVTAMANMARGAIAWAANMVQGIKTWINDNLGPVIQWARDRIRELNGLFAMIRRRQAQVAGGKKDDPSPAPAPAPRAPAGAAPPVLDGGGGGGGGAGRSASNKAADDLKKATERMREALEGVNDSVDRAFGRRELPRSMQQAAEMRKRLDEIEAEARAAGVGMDQFSAGLATARQRIKDLEFEGLAAEAKEFAKDVRALSQDVIDFGGGLPPLEQALSDVDLAYTSLREEIVAAIDANRILAESNDDAAKAMKGLEDQLGALDRAHAKATEAAKANYAAEERLKDLQAGADAMDTQNQIRDFKQARGDGGYQSKGAADLQRIEDDLQRQRMDAQIELASLQAEYLKAEQAGDVAQMGRLQTQIDLQEQLFGIVSETTAKQIQAADRLKTAFDRFTDDLSSELTDMAMDFKFDLDGLRNVFKSLARDLFIKPMTDSISSGIGGFLKSFAGGFAQGGSIAPGQWAVVGENGPEKVYAGAASLSVLSNEDSFGGGRGGGTVNNWNITTPNADSFRYSQRQISRKAKQTLGG